MLFQIRSAVKPPFDAFYQGKKLKSGEEYDLPREGVSLQLREHNPALGKFWFVRIFLAFLGGVLGGRFEDFSALRRKQRQIDVRLEEISDDEISLVCEEKEIRAEGARLTVLRDEEVFLPQIERRIRAYKIGVVVLSLLAVAAALTLLIFALV